jgi:hypothetical protein
MTLRRFDDWGAPGRLGPDDPVATTDAEARALVEEARRAGRDGVVRLGLLGGDLCRTVGGRGDADHLRSDGATELPVDVGSVLADGRMHRFVAHLVARRPGWQGPFLVAMNADWCGPLLLGARAHPGDGLLDVTRGRLSLGDRLRARRRARTGDHLPHPALRTERVKALQHEFDRPVDLWLDGERVGRVRQLSIRVEAGALHVVI